MSDVPPAPLPSPERRTYLLRRAVWARGLWSPMLHPTPSILPGCAPRPACFAYGRPPLSAKAAPSAVRRRYPWDVPYAAPPRVGQHPVALFPIRAGSLSISTHSSHAARRFRRSSLDLHLDAAMHVCPSPRRRRQHVRPHATQLSDWPGQMLKDAPPPPATYLRFVLCTDLRRAGTVSAGCLAVLLFCTQTPCCTRFEFIVRPRLDRVSNDASIGPRRSPPLTRRGPPIPSSGAAASIPGRLLRRSD
ncbi:hypothetical protein B0H13DRAFT_2359846 [Mycena leptocephala]|nr:hypothetical protein B0H13DRAFT_2359846 [Mycena leptocephala]